MQKNTVKVRYAQKVTLVLMNVFVWECNKKPKELDCPGLMEHQGRVNVTLKLQSKS